MSSSLDLAFIKSVMKAKRITQAIIAEKLGVTQSCIGNYFSGRTDPPLQTLLAMSKILGCGLDALLNDKSLNAFDKSSNAFEKSFLTEEEKLFNTHCGA